MLHTISHQRNANQNYRKIPLPIYQDSLSTLFRKSKALPLESPQMSLGDILAKTHQLSPHKRNELAPLPEPSSGLRGECALTAQGGRGDRH